LCRPGGEPTLFRPTEVGFARGLLAYELPDGRLKRIDGHLRHDFDSEREAMGESIPEGLDRCAAASATRHATARHPVLFHLA
jgi:hypothetical protein